MSSLCHGREAKIAFRAVTSSFTATDSVLIWATMTSRAGSSDPKRWRMVSRSSGFVKPSILRTVVRLSAISSSSAASSLVKVPKTTMRFSSSSVSLMREAMVFALDRPISRTCPSSSGRWPAVICRRRVMRTRRLAAVAASPPPPTSSRMSSSSRNSTCSFVRMSSYALSSFGLSATGRTVSTASGRSRHSSLMATDDRSPMISSRRSKFLKPTTSCPMYPPISA